MSAANSLLFVNIVYLFFSSVTTLTHWFNKQKITCERSSGVYVYEHCLKSVYQNKLLSIVIVVRVFRYS